MNPANKKILDDNRIIHTTMVKAQTLRSLDYNTRQQFERIIREEWEPGYSLPCDCGNYVFDMVAKVYRYYDEWLKNNS